jgi:Reverse transcriptase (RNA-dependent DNA polymerase)
VLMINVFYNHNLNLSKINLAIIVLILKNSKNTNIKHYKPINLINYSCKIISKILANRISTVIDSLVDYSQTTFIKGRNIHDNIISAQKNPSSS